MTACSVAYPQSVPVDCVSELVRIVRARRIIEEKSAFARHAWVVQGFLQNKLLGDPDMVVVGAMPDDPDEFCALLLGTVGDDGSGVEIRGAALPFAASILLRWLVTLLMNQVLKQG